MNLYLVIINSKGLIPVKVATPSQLSGARTTTRTHHVPSGSSIFIAVDAGPNQPDPLFLVARGAPAIDVAGAEADCLHSSSQVLHWVVRWTWRGISQNYPPSQGR